MENQEKNHERITKGEDELSARAGDENSRHGATHDESFKTTPRKNRLGWENPQDEQMFESFNDIREQRGEKPEDEEA
ncbi:hypothetical protein GS399_10300 [Pedobacter sp. HMF7647]|uniref:Uncharacterized protein n=1 Tax=Hufsiella arboris TaxID=2695275 RepID=A0A7K1YAA6_9SPHI|nr:hypothetical protein [Hufsiella arboris]MXV51360.1 hypothetical protein [Hufsiella arboris]